MVNNKIKKCIHVQLITLTVVIGSSISFQAYADPELDLRKELAINVLNAWRDNDFPKLEAIENKFYDPSARTPSGKSLLGLFENYLSISISIRPYTEIRDSIINLNPKYSSEGQGSPDSSQYQVINKEWDGIQDKLNKWQQLYPNSPNPYIARAIYYSNRADYFRGVGWASEVNKDAWPIIEKNLKSAEEVLNSSKNISQKNPMWFSVMLGVLGQRSAPRNQIEDVIRTTLEKGQGYSSAIQNAFHFMQPRWGGSYREMEKFAEIANKKTLNTERGGMYARLYWNLVTSVPDEMDVNFYSRTGVDWGTLDSSFDKIITDYPAPRNFSAYALFSCMANDLNKTKKLLQRAQTLSYFATWPPTLQEKCSPN